MKLNIAWRGSKPMYIGVGDTLETVIETGVAVIHSEKEYNDFVENKNVSYGEQGGKFQVMMGWIGNIRQGAQFFSRRELDYLFGRIE